MRPLWLMLALVACGDTKSRGAPEPTPVGSGAPATLSFKVDCNASHAPKPDRDPSPMCLVPAGEFTMGTPVEAERPQDGPARQVRISKPFYMDQLEVTNAQYAQYLRAGGEGCGKAEAYCFGGNIPTDGIDFLTAGFPMEPGQEQIPVRVRLRGAESYCTWAGKRLPTEAQWELAARHDPATGEDRVFPWGNEYRDGVTNSFGAIEPTRGPRAPVGTFPDDRSAVGVLDMGGNSSEWVADCYSLDFSCANPCIDPKHTTKCETVCIEVGGEGCAPGRVLRGGSSGNSPKGLASKRRRDVTATSTGGFRCVRDAR